MFRVQVVGLEVLGCRQNIVAIDLDQLVVLPCSYSSLKILPPSPPSVRLVVAATIAVLLVPVIAIAVVPVVVVMRKPYLSS